MSVPKAPVDYMESTTAKHTGCLTENVVISNDSGKTLVGDTRTWEAECEGKKFQCKVVRPSILTMILFGGQVDIGCNPVE